MLFKWHNTSAKPFYLTQIRLFNVIVPLATTYLLKQDRRLIPFWFKLYMHSPQFGLHDIEKRLQYQKHARLPTRQENKTSYITDMSWPAMVLEDNYSLQWHIAVKKLSLGAELNLWFWFGNSNTFYPLCQLRKYKMKAVVLTDFKRKMSFHISNISLEIFRFKFFFHIFPYEKVTKHNSLW